MTKIIFEKSIHTIEMEGQDVSVWLIVCSSVSEACFDHDEENDEIWERWYVDSEEVNAQPDFIDSATETRMRRNFFEIEKDEV
jgi:hypothetical protein